MPGDAPRFVRIRSRAGEGAVEVAVEDDGVGLSEEDLANVFNPFYSTKPDGMGMGLAISKTIVEAHGGRIGASRGAAGGSRFWFTLPVESKDGWPRATS
jgi:signal transduction histidine kinase